MRYNWTYWTVWARNIHWYSLWNPWHSRGQRFDPAYLHQKNTRFRKKSGVFSYFLDYFSFSILGLDNKWTTRGSQFLLFLLRKGRTNGIYQRRTNKKQTFSAFGSVFWHHRQSVSELLAMIVLKLWSADFFTQRIFRSELCSTEVLRSRWNAAM